MRRLEPRNNCRLRPVIGNQIRNIKRWNQIIQVLARYGFVEFLREIGLGNVVAGLLDRVRIGRSEAALVRMPTPVRLRHAMEELGPTFIKLGQVLSTRRDLVPDDWADEFAKLQSGCPAVPWGEIEQLLLESYPAGIDSNFASIDKEPIAAASMVTPIDRSTGSSPPSMISRSTRFTAEIRASRRAS